MDREEQTILAIDCATANLQLGLQYGSDRLVKSSERADRSHGQIIIRKIQVLLDSAAVTIDSLSSIVVCIGPGSFTGLRIGLSTAKGIAVALDIPIVGMSLFEIAASKLKNRPGIINLLTPFLRDEQFMTTIENGKITDDEATTVRSSDLMSPTEQLIAIGFVSDETRPQHADGSAVELIDYDCADLLYLGIEKLSSGGADDLSQLEPLYLRKSQAEIKYDERARKDS